MRDDLACFMTSSSTVRAAACCMLYFLFFTHSDQRKRDISQFSAPPRAVAVDPVGLGVTSRLALSRQRHLRAVERCISQVW